MTLPAIVARNRKAARTRARMQAFRPAKPAAPCSRCGGVRDLRHYYCRTCRAAYWRSYQERHAKVSRVTVTDLVTAHREISKAKDVLAATGGGPGPLSADTRHSGQREALPRAGSADKH